MSKRLLAKETTKLRSTTITSKIQTPPLIQIEMRKVETSKRKKSHISYNSFAFLLSSSALGDTASFESGDILCKKR